MKNVGIHVLDFNDNIIDFISQSDGALINAEMSMNVEEKTETFDFTIENTRAEKLRERNRIIAQDNNGTFREFIIIHITDNFDGTTEIECNASYLEDLKTAKPIKPGKFEAHTTTQALLKTLADTGWEVSDDTEYGGNRTTSWTSHTNPFDLIYMLCTTYSMVPEFYIELSAHSVEHRYVSIAKPKNLFKGKEITKGKDLTGMTRTIDLSEVKTALLAVGPEKEDGSRIETVVVDDEAQEIFGLPNRYIWDVYEPESNDENMTLKRLTTLAKTELNKRNQAAISYEVSSLDIHKYYNDVTVHLRDIVRVKDRDFRPPLYIEAEVIGIKYNWLADESEFTFGNVIEYEETKLREFFTRKLDEITKKLNDNFSNVNTIVRDVVAGELEYYERKIFKGVEPPENPQNDTLWYDTSNPNVAVLRRYWNGKWITQTADDVEKIGGLRRERVMYRDLNNSFINLTIQHSKLQNDVYDVLNNEYLVDDDLKANLNQALSDVDGVYQNIKTNLDSMDEDTATIGKLVDTQTLFTVYREKLQTLYKYVTDAKISIDKRLKLLQSQYTDEKFNDAMDKIAQTLPNGRWDSENQQLYADIPNRNEVENLKTTLQDYTDGQISNLNSVLGKEIDSKIKNTKDEISANVRSIEHKIDGIEVGGRNLIRNSEKITDYIILASVEKAGTYSLGFEPHFTENIPSEFGLYYGGNIDVLANDKPRITHTFEVGEDRIGKDIKLFFGGNAMTHKAYINNGYVGKVKLEYGNVATDWTPAPEDVEDKILNSKQEAEEASKAYAKAQDELKQTEIQAYADGKVLDEEKRAIADAIAKRDEAKEYAEQKAQEAQEAANQNTSNQLVPITTRVTTNETNITELDEQISLMAKSDDVEQKLKNVDGRLTPLETTVKSNKATLDILPTQIESKVSKQDYKTDQNNIVQRLDNADSERKQLSNEITDKVTITKFESGITEAKNYTDDYKRSNDVAMTKLETSVSQLDGKVSIKVDEQKFNASRKTLSQVISEISATTKGINLSYDENGNIQSYTMDRNGIKIDGSKIDINQGDVVIQNGVTKIKDAYIDYLFAKDAFIDKLKARDIDFNRATANGSSGSATLSIMGDRILQSGKFKRIWKGVTYDYDVSTIMREGYIKFADFNRNREISISAFGISTFVDGSGTQDGYEGSSGTISWWDKTYGDADGITMSSEVGVAALKSYQNRVVLDANSTVDIYSKTNAIHLNPLVYDYDGVNRFAFTIADSSTYGRVGYVMFGAGTDGVEYGSGLRFHKPRNQPRVSVVDKNYATSSNTILEAGIGEFENINTRYNTLFLNVSSIGEVRVQEKGSSNYRDIRFGKWYAMSSEKYKYDINEWNYSVLDAYRNDLKLYSYKYKGEKNSDYIRNHHGVIIERELPIEWRHGDGFDGNEVMFWNSKAIQELIEKVDKLEEQLNEQSNAS